MLKRCRLVFRQKHPYRFLASRLLMLARVSHFLRIERGKYRLIFFPTALSASLWVDPDNRLDEELFLARWLRPGDTAVDVGANIGSITLAMAASVGPSGKILSLEPHARLYTHLVKNIRFNGAHHVLAAQTAAGNVEGVIGLSDLKSDDENSVITSPARLTVPIVQLDKLAPPGRIRLIKIDVEGYEPAVLAGARQALARTDIVYFEASPTFLARQGFEWNDTATLLREAGFKLMERSADGLVALADNLDRRKMVFAVRPMILSERALERPTSSCARAE